MDSDVLALQPANDTSFMNFDTDSSQQNSTSTNHEPATISTNSSTSDIVLPDKTDNSSTCSYSGDVANHEQQDFDAFCEFAFPENDSFSHLSSTSDPFYFESDHLALKGNSDYCRLLRTFALLQSQRTAALHDLDVLLERQRQALNDPVQFAQQLLQGNAESQFPRPRKVAEIPAIAWERYTDDVEAVLASLGGSQHATRQKQKCDLMSGIRDFRSVTPTPSSYLSTESVPSGVEMCSRKHRPATFNQPWSAEEQRHLEQLLRKYPPERFEARRFAKIAAELPGRTTQQVTSRVQKYFIKLAKAGLPIPGRMPNLAAYGGRWHGGRFHGHQQRYSHLYHAPSTFLTSFAPPVYMSDDDDDDVGQFAPKSEIKLEPAAKDTVFADAFSTSDDEDKDLASVPLFLRNTAEFQELKRLTALRKSQTVWPGRENWQDSTIGSEISSFSGYGEQNRIKAEPLGTFYRRSHIDPDYTSESTGVSSYLDPNYMPAV